jgi:hypothetical protein
VTVRGTVPAKHQAAIRRAELARVRADRAYRDAIAAAANDGDASIRELAAFTGLAPNTVRKIIDGR